MDKKTLQNSILEKAYQPSTWLDVMKDYFGAKKFHQKPQSISLPNNDIAESAVELGSFYTADERLIGIYEVNLNPKAWLDKNRVGLRNLLRQVYKFDVDGALIVFVQGEKWRFSFVSEIRTEESKKETEPKRYTYLFGKGESCRTAAERFDKLKGKPIYLADLFDAFSVDKLNKDFFKSYKEFFEKFSAHLASNSDYRKIILDSKKELEKGWKDNEAKPIRDFVKKLLGRIVFLQFLQKKGWMGVPANHENWTGGDAKFLQNLFLNYADKEHFHSKALKTLFFETLNKKRDNHLAPSALGDHIKIPYLNGGLFDKDFSYNQNIDFPADLFKNLLEFFESYNFTIDENDPYDSEVGIDPEMLGHIFENLLEENREKGAFYTPKQIVHYMCQESLIQYLRTHLPECTEDESPATKALENFIRNGIVGERNDKKNFVVQQAKRIENLLDKVKICDPAIGSGAFPMGMLQEIFKAKTALDLTLDHAETKKQIIQNCIYGVDIENGAVEIARLRFWLALVVDETEPQPLPNLDYKIMQGNSLLESFEGIDLSNLMDNQIKPEYQKLYEQAALFNEPYAELFTNAQDRENLQKLIHLYYDFEAFPNKYDSKNDVKTEINKIIDNQLKKFFKKRKIDLEKEKENENFDYIYQSNQPNVSDSKKWKDTKIKNLNILEQKKLKYEQLSKNLDDILEKLKLLENQDTARPYFLWHTYFKEVFDQGGFDIVIGNPPYIQLQKMTNAIDVLEKTNFKTFARGGDIYCLFYELGNILLKGKGTLCYITSNKWMNAAYGKNLRTYLFQETNPTLLIDFSKVVIFEAAVVFVNILQFKKEKNKNELRGVKVQDDFQINKTPLTDYVSQNAVTLSELNDESWSVSEKKDFAITKKIDEVGVPLKQWNVQFNSGIKTAMNPAFHINAETRKELINEDNKNVEIIKPLLRGKDIKRWVYHFENLYLINSHNGVKEKGIPRIDVEKDYPSILKHLLQFYDKDSPKAVKNPDGSFQTLKDRLDKGEHWSNLRNCAYIEEFEKEKIVWIEISDRANYCLDTEGYYLTNSAYFLTGENLKYLLAVLNSRLMDFYFFQKTAQIAGGRKRYTKQYVELLPIIEHKKLKHQLTIEELVNKILELKKEKLPTSLLENKIDALVFHLYSLTEQEMLQVLDTFKDLSIKDRNQIQNEYWNIANNKFQLDK